MQQHTTCAQGHSQEELTAAHPGESNTYYMQKLGWHQRLYALSDRQSLPSLMTDDEHVCDGMPCLNCTDRARARRVCEHRRLDGVRAESQGERAGGGLMVLLSKLNIALSVSQT